MKRSIIAFISSVILFSSATTSSAAETYTLDPGHTYVLWRISHFGFSTQAGKWYASGTLVLDKDKPENSKVNAKINVADMATGMPLLDEHLKGKSFFDTAKYPTATFVSDSVVMAGDSKADVHGVLTVHGVSKPVVLMVKLNKSDINPITKKQTVGFSAVTAVKRSDFGITTALPGLGDDVALQIEAEASPAKK